MIEQIAASIVLVFLAVWVGLNLVKGYQDSEWDKLHHKVMNAFIHTVDQICVQGVMFAGLVIVYVVVKMLVNIMMGQPISD